MVKIHSIFIYIFISAFVLSEQAGAAMVMDSAKKDVSGAATQKFNGGNSIRQYISFSAYRDSDYNSQDHKAALKYSYRSNKIAALAEFSHQDKRLRATNGNGDFKSREEKRDMSTEAKIKILDQQNYVILYYRSIHQVEDNSGSDIQSDFRSQSALGLGRAFFDGDLEIDLSFGYEDQKNEGYSISLIPSFRFEHEFTENIRFTQRGYAFIDDYDDLEYEIKTYLTYRLNKKLSLRLTHLQQKILSMRTDKQDNRVTSKILMGLVFNF